MHIFKKYIPANRVSQGQSKIGLSPKSFIVAGVEGHLGVFYATTIGLCLLSRPPVPYVSCIGQAACRDFDTGNTMGSGTA